MIRLFFSLQGRTGRLGFWFGFACLAILGTLLAVPAMPSIFSDNPLRDILTNTRQLGLYGLGISLVLFYPAIAITTKRLHDRNKSGWYTALLWLPLLVQFGTPYVEELGSLERVYHLSTWLALEMLAVGLWFFIELGFYPGTAGANAYGPEPGGNTDPALAV